jgi:hypothetical protein
VPISLLVSISVLVLVGSVYLVGGESISSPVHFLTIFKTTANKMITPAMGIIMTIIMVLLSVLAAVVLLLLETAWQ